MNIDLITQSLKDCPCGRNHIADIKGVYIENGVLARCGELLKENGFPKKLLLVADKNTLNASSGITEILEESGFDVSLMLFEDLRVADITDVRKVRDASRMVEGILSVGTGSLNDICRLAAYEEEKEFAIFATAPSMDGFASGTAPITENNFKSTRQAKQPSVILADTKILANSPAELKAAGFGDIMAKFTAITDWRISALLTDEYYCERIADMVRNTANAVASMADRISVCDEEAAKALMEALVITGIAMKYAESVRPASGAEHVISHYWEIKKLEKGLISDFHGKKVGVAVLKVIGLYKKIATAEIKSFHLDKTDYNQIYEVYGENFRDEVEKINVYPITSYVTPEKLFTNWIKIRRIIEEELISEDEMKELYKKAGAATGYSDIGVDDKLGDEGVKYHSYMRNRITLTRMLNMIDFEDGCIYEK